MVKIIMDSREKEEEIYSTLQSMSGLELQISTLPVGDYILSKDVCVERKSWPDFFGSVHKLSLEFAHMSKYYKHKILLLEGNIVPQYDKGNFIYTKQNSIPKIFNWEPSSIENLLYSWHLAFDIYVLKTLSSHSSAITLYKLASMLQKEKKHSKFSIRGKPKIFTMREQQRFFLEGLPSIAGTLSDRLLSVGSPKKIFDKICSNKKIRIAGLGKTKLTAIKQVLTTRTK